MLVQFVKLFNWRVHVLWTGCCSESAVQIIALGGIGRGHLLAWETDGIAESAVIAHRSHLGSIEDVEWRNRPYSIAANQIMLMAHSFKVVRIDDVHEIFERTEQFADWTRKDTENTLAVLADRWLLR